MSGTQLLTYIQAADIMDAEGPWFNGVEYLQEKEPDDVFVAATKSQKFGIIGGGMSGLMTSHLLTSVGIHDWKILEASQRIGGRVHTSYLNGTAPDEYQYQEMGPMRFPVSITYDDPAETIQIMDHRMVFQLADELNKQNGNASEYQVNFIKWIQSAANDPASTSARRPDGTVPGAAEVAANAAYQTNSNLTYSNATAVALASDAYDDWMGLNGDAFKAIATNVFQAHKWSVDNGYFHFSEAGYLNYQLGIYCEQDGIYRPQISEYEIFACIKQRTTMTVRASRLDDLPKYRVHVDASYQVADMSKDQSRS